VPPSCLELHISSASVWEMAIKASLGCLTLPDTLDKVDKYVAEKIQMGYRMTVDDR
jgi:PIN domain nuclease of toxin-antitoxin system